MAFEEILNGPLAIHKAPVGESFPDLTVSPPGGNWELVGKSGNENYTDDGVSVNLAQTIEEFTPDGSTMAVKAFRTEESVEVVVTVADTRAETMKTALNENTVTEGASDVEVPLIRGAKVATFALLLRGKSPYAEDGTGQFQLPRCYMSGEPELVWQKGEPVGTELTFRTLKPASPEDMKAMFTNGSGS